jgi:enoyl-CoA hydratase/carnithine racemase
MNYENIEVERRDAVCLLTLNRPHRLNALSPELVGDLTDFFGSLKDDRQTRIIIMRGAGRSFCAGADLRGEIADDPSKPGRVEHAYSSQQAFSDCVLRMRRAPQPIIAAVHGHAIGAGCAFAMACDMRIAGESARFNVRFTRVGASGGDCGSSYFLPRVIGLARAAELMYTARWVDAITAEKIGLVSKVVPDDQLEDAAMELAREVLKNAPAGVRMTKEILNSCMDAPSLITTLHLEDRTQILCTFTEDFQEAVTSIFEKREPVWQDR